MEAEGEVVEAIRRRQWSGAEEIIRRNGGGEIGMEKTRVADGGGAMMEGASERASFCVVHLLRRHFDLRLKYCFSFFRVLPRSLFLFFIYFFSCTIIFF